MSAMKPVPYWLDTAPAGPDSRVAEVPSAASGESAGPIPVGPRPDKPRTKSAGKPTVETTSGPKAEVEKKTESQRCVWCFPPSSE